MLDGERDGAPIALASTTVGKPVDKSPSGIWSRIVCSACEQGFHAADEYLIWVARSLPTFPAAFEGNITVLEGVNAARLQRAVLSVLFRAHLSDHHVFSLVDLGVHAEALRTYLEDENSPLPNAYSINLRHLSHELGKAWFCPFREKWNDVNAYRFYFPSLTAIVRVDRRQLPEPWPSFSLGATDPPVALRIERFSPSEMRLFRQIAEQNGAQLNRLFSKFARQ